MLPVTWPSPHVSRRAAAAKDAITRSLSTEQFGNHPMYWLGPAPSIPDGQCSMGLVDENQRRASDAWSRLLLREETWNVPRKGLTRQVRGRVGGSQKRIRKRCADPRLNLPHTLHATSLQIEPPSLSAAFWHSVFQNGAASGIVATFAPGPVSF